MGYNQPETATSKFNAGILQMDRLHHLQDTLNEININLLTFNENIGKFNFEIKLSVCDTIKSEIWGKLSPEEKVQLQDYTDSLHKLTREHNLYDGIRNKSGRVNSKLNYNLWLVIENWLNKYELRLKEIMNTHQFNSPDADEDFGL